MEGGKPVLQIDRGSFQWKLEILNDGNVDRKRWRRISIQVRTVLCALEATAVATVPSPVVCRQP